MRAKIYNLREWIKIIDPKFIRDQFTTLLKSCGFTIMGYLEHDFEPQGFSAIWLLAESHLAIHTWPEEGKAYIELSSCNEEMYKEFRRQMLSIQ